MIGLVWAFGWKGGRGVFFVGQKVRVLVTINRFVILTWHILYYGSTPTKHERKGSATFIKYVMPGMFTADYY